MLTPPIRSSFLELVSLFSLSLILFVWGVHSSEVVGFDSRFYLFAQEMWQHGATWFPTTYQRPYPDYPVTSTLLIYLIANLCGELNKLVAVLPTAIAAAITLTLTYAIGAIHNKRWGICAVLFLLLTITFLKSARSIALDMYLTMITTFCFYLIYSADVNHQSYRLWFIYPLLLLGFAFRGPIGLVIPAGVVCTYYLVDRNMRMFFVSGFFAFIILIISTLFLLDLAYHIGGERFMQNVLHMQVLGRIKNDDLLPTYFYFLYGLKNYALSFPIALIVMLGWGYTFWQKRSMTVEMNFIWKLFGWMLIILIGMSIPGDKKIRYILPLIPAAALIAAHLFVMHCDKIYFLVIRWLLTRIFLFFPILFLVLTLKWFLHQNTLEVRTYPIGIMISLILLQIINVFIYLRFANKKNKPDLYILFIATLAFVFTYISMIEPVTLEVDKARDFVIAVEKVRLKKNARLVFYRENSDGIAIKYLINMPNRETPIFAPTVIELIAFSQDAFFVTRSDYFYTLPNIILEKFHIITQGKLGHKMIVVFAKNTSV